MPSICTPSAKARAPSSILFESPLPSPNAKQSPGTQHRHARASAPFQQNIASLARAKTPAKATMQPVSYPNVSRRILAARSVIGVFGSALQRQLLTSAGAKPIASSASRAPASRPRRDAAAGAARAAHPRHRTSWSKPAIERAFQLQDDAGGGLLTRRPGCCWTAATSCAGDSPRRAPGATGTRTSAASATLGPTPLTPMRLLEQRLLLER